MIIQDKYPHRWTIKCKYDMVGNTFKTTIAVDTEATTICIINFGTWNFDNQDGFESGWRIKIVNTKIFCVFALR